MNRMVATLGAAIIAFLPFGAEASGFRLYEQSNMGQGMSHAVAASVDDASAVYYNPAAMVDMGHYAVSAGIQAIDPMTEYSGQGESELLHSNVTIGAPHLYLIKAFADNDMALGLGVFSNFGFATQWNDDTPFRYVATESELATYTTNVNFAKRFGDQFSLAVGIDFLTVTSARYNSMYDYGSGADDGIQSIEEDGNGWGFNVAGLYKPNESLSVGLTYRSAITTTISGDASVDNIPGSLESMLGGASVTDRKYTSDVETDLEFPAIAVIGIAFNATEQVTIEVDVDWTGWSSYEELRHTVSDPLTTSGGATILPSEIVTEANYEDTISYRVGVSYQATEKFTVRFGGAFEPTPVPVETVDPRIAGADRTVVSFGFTLAAADNFNVDGGVAYFFSDTLTVENEVGSDVDSSVDGDYTTTGITYGLSFGYKF